MIAREALERREAETLAPYAAKSAESLGRAHPEAEHPMRTAFQRDRDRIVHTTAFRRLEYKTQVFVNHEGDHYRTRLTHTLEVAQLARSIARALRLNEDLAEAVALAHDLGHPPFGHSGEDALKELMEEHGNPRGFDHNLQGLRVVEELEERYAAFRGLNLTWETREGILKQTAGYRGSFPPGLGPECAPSLEAAVVDLADEIAYNSHDLDDGLYSGLLAPEELKEVELWAEGRERAVGPAQAGGAAGSLGEQVTQRETIRRIINAQVSDLIETAARNVEERGLRSIEEVRRRGHGVVAFSPAMRAKNEQLKAFLMERMYKNYRVLRMEEKGKRILGDLFRAYVARPAQLPPHVQARLREDPPDDPCRTVCDYVAGMTDRFALQEHKKLFDPHERV